MNHKFIPTHAPLTRPQLSADPDILARAIGKVGCDWAWAGAVLYAGRVGAA